MTFSFRTKTVAAMMLGVVALIGIGTPGLAAAPDKVVVETSGTDGVVRASAGASFASLSDAVAAQDTDTLDSELSCMAAAVYFESKGEPLNGQLAVADVILNRTKSGRYPSSICGVVTQPSQFSFVRAGRIPEIAMGHMYRTAIAVARVAMTGAWDSPAPAALSFHARRVAPGWRMTEVAAIGNHIFYR